MIRTIIDNLHDFEHGFRRWLLDFLIFSVAVGILASAWALTTVAVNLHELNESQAKNAAQIRVALIGRLDQFLWKTDTMLAIMRTTSKSIDAGLLNVRIQVKQSQDSQDRSMRDLQRTTSAAVTRGIRETATAVREANQSSVDEEPKEPAVIVAPVTPVPIPLPQPPPPPPVAQKPKRTPNEKAEPTVPKERQPRIVQWLDKLKFW